MSSTRLKNNSSQNTTLPKYEVSCAKPNQHEAKIEHGVISIRFDKQQESYCKTESTFAPPLSKQTT